MTKRWFVLMGALALATACADDVSTDDGGQDSSTGGTSTSTTTSTSTSAGTSTSSGSATGDTTGDSSGGTSVDGSGGATTGDGTTEGGTTEGGTTEGGTTSGTDGTTGGVCDPITEDISGLGDMCKGDPDCPEGYTCFDGGGLVSQPLCQIICTQSCECPTDYTCEFHDVKGNQWYQCDPA